MLKVWDAENVEKARAILNRASTMELMGMVQLLETLKVNNPRARRWGRARCSRTITLAFH